MKRKLLYKINITFVLRNIDIIKHLITANSVSRDDCKINIVFKHD